MFEKNSFETDFQKRGNQFKLVLQAGDGEVGERDLPLKVSFVMTNKQTNRQTDKQTDRQTDIYTRVFIELLRNLKIAESELR